MIIKRDLYNQVEKYINSKQAIIITGMRRVGKTTLLKFIFNKIDSKNKLFIDLENILNQKIFEEQDYERIKMSLENLGLDFQKKAWLFLDEIQFVKNIPSVVKYLIDHYKIKFFLTGSASFYLKNLFSESLSGRKYLFELFPLSFKEFLMLKQEKIKIPGQKITKFIFSRINNLYEEYMNFGGFPEVILVQSVEEKQKLLDDILSSYIQLEVKALSDFRKTNIIRDLILLLVSRTGSSLDIKKLSSELKIARETVLEYLSFLEGTYLIKLIKPFSKNRDVEIRKISKIYFCDSGLVNRLAQISPGSLFEQNIFQGLRMQGELNYYQKKSGVEIDFILDKKKAFEVKLNHGEPDLQRLKRLSGDIGIKKYHLVSKNYTELKHVLYGFQL